MSQQSSSPAAASAPPPLNDEMRREEERLHPYLREAGISINWHTVVEYLKILEEGGISVNVAPMAAFGNIRRYVMGMEMRPPTPEELEAMKSEIEKAMEAGCLGLSTGLRYAPQSYASTEEVIELAKVVARYGGFYSSHIRDEGDMGNPVAAVEEIIRIGEEAELPVHVSHFKVLSRRLWSLCPRLIQLVEEARARGLDITADQYPYSASGTGPGPWIPHWAHEGGPEELAKRLRDPGLAPKIRAALAESMEERGGATAALISSYPADPSLVGKTIEEAAEMRGERPEEAIFNLFREHIEKSISGEVEGGFSIVNFNQSEENIEAIMGRPWVAFGTDGSVHSPKGPLRRHQPSPHPGSYEPSQGS